MKSRQRLGLASLLGLGATLLSLGCDGCDGPDKIILDNRSGNEIGVLVDAADESGEFIDRTFLTTDTLIFDFDVLGRADDLEEATAFTARRPPFARNPCTFHEGTDLALINFQDEIEIDFAVWIVDVDIVNTVTNRENETLDALAFTEQQWQQERMGLVVGDIDIHDMTADADADDLRDCDDCDDAYFEDLRNDIGYTEGRINIYLIRNVTDGMWSKYMGSAGDIGDSDQLVMGMYTGSEDLLIHEIGHLQTLEHTDGDPNFDNKNVMPHSGGVFTKRQFLTEGQSFRATFDDNSVLNVKLNKRTGLYMTDCTHSTTATVTCPCVQKRIWADGSLPAN